MFFDLGEHFHRQVGARVEHAWQHARDLQGGVELGLYEVNDLEQFGHALQRQILRLHWDDDEVGRYQRVGAEHPERRWAVE